MAERGGGIAIHITGDLNPSILGHLRVEFARLDATVEAPPDLKFAVITVPVAHGFPAIEHAIRRATKGAVEWYFGNVYDDHDRPLNWWA